jgi:hypothetical protein
VEQNNAAIFMVNASDEDEKANTLSPIRCIKLKQTTMQQHINQPRIQ